MWDASEEGFWATQPSELGNISKTLSFDTLKRKLNQIFGFKYLK